MSWLLTDQEFRQAATAVRVGEMTPALYGFIGRLVAAQLRSGVVSPTLSGSGVWSEEEIADTTHDWIAEKLLPGALLLAFDHTSTPQALARYLERALRNWLRDKARSRAWPRILLRARQIFGQANERFAPFDEPSNWMEQRWGLAGWTEPPAIDDEHQVIRAVCSAPDLEIVRESGETSRAAAILSTPDLERLLEHVLQTVGGTITLAQLDRAFRNRFAWAFEAPAVELEEAAEEETQSAETASNVLATETALAILTDLTERQLEMLRERAEGATLEQLAEMHGCSRGTADNELKRAASTIRRYLVSDDLQERTLEILLTLSFSERG
jgi:RNA polymerase sigma factor (sigma-70 family)